MKWFMLRICWIFSNKICYKKIRLKLQEYQLVTLYFSKDTGSTTFLHCKIKWQIIAIYNRLTLFIHPEASLRRPKSNKKKNVAIEKRLRLIFDEKKSCFLVCGLVEANKSETENLDKFQMKLRLNWSSF